MRLSTSAMVTELSKRTHWTSHKKSTDRLVFFLNEVQEDIELLREDWRFCQFTGDNAHDITTEDGTRDYDLTDNFMWPISLRDTTNDQKLTAKSASWLARHNPDLSGTGRPYFYVLTGPNGTDGVESVRFEDCPAGEYTVRVEYYGHLPALVNSDTNYSRIPYSSLLMAGAEIRARVDNEESEDSQVIRRLTGKYLTALERLRLHYGANPDQSEGIQADPQMFGGGDIYGG